MDSCIARDMPSSTGTQLCKPRAELLGTCLPARSGYHMIVMIQHPAA